VKDQGQLERLTRLGPRNLAASCLVLALTVFLVWIAVATYAFSASGADGLFASVVAGLVCFASAAAALVLTAQSSGKPHTAVNGLLLAMLLRMGVPLGVGISLQSAQGRLADGGVFGLIVVFYLVTLVVETILSLRFVQNAQVAGETKAP
jgi:hypothetical protein